MATLSKPIEEIERGVDTPAADDLLVQCGGGCGKICVIQHPRHIRGGAKLNQETGELETWTATPEWVEQEVERRMTEPTYCHDCGRERFAGGGAK